MNKKLIILSIIILVGSLLFLGITNYNSDSKIKSIGNYTNIDNTTDYEYADDILGYLLYDIMNYDSISVIIASIDIQSSTHEIDMITKQYEFNDRMFYIGIANGLSNYELKLKLCH